MRAPPLRRDMTDSSVLGAASADCALPQMTSETGST